MRMLVGAILIGVLVSSASSDTSQLSQAAQNTLTTIDSVPTRPQLDAAFSGSGQALAGLSAVATDPGNDIGIRLRAVHALGKYCAAPTCVDGDTAHQSLKTVIDANRTATSGSNVLLLRAAIETLGSMRISGDAAYLIAQGTPNLTSLLDHPSRDVRATTAEALQNICNTSVATNPLRIRYSHETTEQVKLAISEALRILGQCSAN